MSLVPADGAILGPGIVNQPLRNDLMKDRQFIHDCLANKVTFESCMEHLRRRNNVLFRKHLFNHVIPKRLVQRCETQCLLEGLMDV